MSRINLFAKTGTKERMLIQGNNTGVETLTFLNNTFGGSWVKCGEMTLNECLKFESTEDYKGFDNREDDNYCVGAIMDRSKL